MALPDEAPGSHSVGNDVDREFLISVLVVNMIVPEYIDEEA